MSKKTQKSALALILAAGLTLGLVACAPGTGDGTRTGDGELRKITVAVTSPNHPVEFFPIHLAVDLGYFEDEGLEVAIEEAPGSGGALQLLLAGNAQFATPSPPGYFAAIGNGAKATLVYQMKYSNVFDLIAPPDSGIRSVKDLEGQNVGVSALSGGEVPFVRAVLGSAGLIDGQNVNIVPVGEGGQTTVQAFESGAIDAFGGSVYDLAVLAANGLEQKSIVPDEFVQQPANSIFTTPGFADSDPEVVEKFLRAVSKATLWAQNNDAAARQIIQKGAPALYSSDDLFNELFDVTDRLLEQPASLADAGFGAIDWDGWERFYKALEGLSADEGGLAAPFDLHDYLTDKFLSAANDFDHDEVLAEAKDYEAK